MPNPLCAKRVRLVMTAAAFSVSLVDAFAHALWFSTSSLLKQLEHTPQVLPIEGQNDGPGRVEDCLISAEQFRAYVNRHLPAAEAAGVPLVAEGNDEMRASYCMMDARGRFFANHEGAYEYGPSIFDVGVMQAWAAAAHGFSAATFAERQGVYDWGQGQEALEGQQSWATTSQAAPVGVTAGLDINDR